MIIKSWCFSDQTGDLLIEASLPTGDVMNITLRMEGGKNTGNEFWARAVKSYIICEEMSEDAINGTLKLMRKDIGK